MPWPNRSDYAEAVRNYPHISFQDPKLKGGKPKQGKDGFLISHEGGFSIVFPIVKGANTFALRCWTQDVTDAEVRYKEVSTYLKGVRLPYFVGFKYVPEGILVNGSKYPITRMDWVDGVSLRDFISQNLRNAHCFKDIATKFQEMVAVLHKHKISHGDLQDGNILLKRSGNNVEIKLIDYDSLFVPALKGQLDSIFGLPEYQHPARNPKTKGLASEKVDYFSELVIYLSFLALSEKPQLWHQFEDKTEKGLLFSEKDFENPSQSPIFRDLANLSPDVQQLALTLKDFCGRNSLNDLEPLEAILPKSNANAYTERGFFFLNDGQYTEALTEFKEAIILDSGYERARLGLAHVYLRTERYTEAIDTFQQAIRQNPNYKEAHHGLGLAYYRSGDNNRATAAANAALRIDSRYQPARALLGIIRPPTVSTTSSPIQSNPTTKSRSTTSSAPISSARSKQHSTNSVSRSNTSQTTRTNPVKSIWQYITNPLKNSQYSVPTGVLGLALVICFIALLMQMNAKDKFASQDVALKKQLAQKESDIQGLNTSIENLETRNEELNRENGRLQAELADLKSTLRTTSRNVAEQHQHLSNQNQLLQNQLTTKDDEIQQLRNDKAAAINENQRLKNYIGEDNRGTADQNATIQQLQREKAKALTENRGLQGQLAEKILEAKNLTRQIQQLQNEKVEIQRQNQKLQSKNTDPVRQNRNLPNENATLRDQPNKPDLTETNKTVSPEPPKQIRDYRETTSRARSHNNQGCFEFEDNDYEKAIKQFGQAIKADSKLVIAHYNLGCTYLQMKEYPKAISAFNEAVVLNQKFKEAYYNRSLAYFRMNLFQEAKQDATKAIDIDPNYSLALELSKTIEKFH